MGDNSDIFQEIFNAGLEAVSDSADKVKEVVDNLVKEGQNDNKGKEFVDSAIAEQQFRKISLASHPDFQKVVSEISQLKDKIAKFEESRQEKEDK